ncbi:MAG TPA: outer membrane lipoprotein-sorting protein [Thermoanaerobaculia bacterium]|nr:outer membrane lipoprotein-sorting protein [Thermoanaerobaculia bacterium]
MATRAAAPLAPVALLLAALAAAAGAAEPTPADRALLAASNLFAAAPEQFRARVAVRTTGGDDRTELEIWRGGRDRLLVRPLAARQRGKLILQIGAERWLFTPGTRQPVKLGARFRLHGGLSFEELLGIDIERGYRLLEVDSTGRVVTFHLEADEATAAATGTAAARWVVDRETRRPLRADLLAAGGRVVRVIEFRGFRAGRQPVPEVVVLKDVLRRTPPLEVELLEIEERAVPEALFDLADGSARARLLADDPAGP